MGGPAEAVARPSSPGKGGSPLPLRGRLARVLSGQRPGETTLARGVAGVPAAPEHKGHAGAFPLELGFPRWFLPSTENGSTIAY